MLEQARVSAASNKCRGRAEKLRKGPAGGICMAAWDARGGELGEACGTELVGIASMGGVVFWTGAGAVLMVMRTEDQFFSGAGQRCASRLKPCGFCRRGPKPFVYVKLRGNQRET